MTWHHLFLWLLLIWSAGWLFFPFSLRIFGGLLPDGGLAVGRVLFLTLATLGAFWTGNFGVSTQNGTLFGLALAVAGLILAGHRKKEIRGALRERRRAIWASETLSLLVFFTFFILRGFWSDTSGTNGEKAMDSALIGSLVRAPRLPAPNPYAAGANLTSYYYFGHLQTALLSAAGDIPVRWSYNLMCATLPALCFSTLFSLGAALTGRLRGGLIVSLCVLGLGTLQPIYQFYQWLHPENPGPRPPFHLNFFAVSRVLPYSINEFPFFTFNQGDLHAHYFGLPLALATICLAWAIFQGKTAALWLATLVLGAQILTNTWDFPAYAILIGLSILARPDGGVPSKSIGTVGLLWISALAVAAPYLLNLRTAASPPRLLPFPASPLREWLLLWGVVAFSWTAFLAYSAEALRPLRGFLLGLGALFGLYALALPWERPDPFVLPLILFLLALSGWGARQSQGQTRFLCLLAFCGLLALAWSETTWAGFLGNPDNPGLNDYKRQDTVFKFGLQTWILWGTAASCGAILSFARWPRAFQYALMPALGVMAMASVAVVFGRARNFERFDAWDGWAHLAPDEKAAAGWLLQHVPRGQNLLEAEQLEGGDYTPYGRYASATGIPAITGPRAHTFQWSPANSGRIDREWAEVERRRNLTRALYNDLHGLQRLTVLRSLGARFIIFGELEREQYGGGALYSLRHDSEITPVAHFETPEPVPAEGLLTPHDVWIFEAK